MVLNGSPFECNTCGHPFSCKDSLIRHQWNCRPVERVPCSVSGIPVGEGAQGMTRHQRTQRCARFTRAGHREMVAHRRVEAISETVRRIRARAREGRQQHEESKHGVLPGSSTSSLILPKSEAAPSIDVNVIDLTEEREVQDAAVEIHHTTSNVNIHVSDALGEESNDEGQECMMLCYEIIPSQDEVPCPANNTCCDGLFDRTCSERCLYEHRKCPICMVVVPGRREHRPPPTTCSVCRCPTPGHRSLRAEGTTCEHVYHFECFYARCLGKSHRGVARVRGYVLCPLCSRSNYVILENNNVSSRLLIRLHCVDIDLDVFTNFCELIK